MSLSTGIDVGTSEVRVSTVDIKGKPILTSWQKHLEQQGNETDPEFWWYSVLRCITSHLASLKKMSINPKEIKSIAVAATSGSLTLVGSNLRPVTKSLMYGYSNFKRELEMIKKKVPFRHIVRTHDSALARALKLISKDHENRATHLMCQADFISAKLMNRGGFSDHNNMLKLGFDPNNNNWPDWLFEIIIPGRLLPKVYPPGKPYDTICKTLATSTGLSKDVIIHAGSTDSIAGFLAASPLITGSAVTSLGSTLAVKLLCKNRIENPEIGLYSHKLGEFWLAGGASNTGGKVMAQYFSEAQIIKLSGEMNPNKLTGLNYYPLIKTGERFPENNPKMRPLLSPRPHQKVLFLQGIMEGIARIEKKAYGVIQAYNQDPPKVIETVGKGATNLAWRKIRENILGMEVRTAATTEASIGAARIPLILSKDK